MLECVILLVSVKEGKIMFEFSKKPLAGEKI